MELPGGQVHEYESFLDVEKREVLGDTGLEVYGIEGQSSMVEW